MSVFSEKLSGIIKQHEQLNIYNIAKEIGCERSWFQKVVSGDRKMNVEFIRPLCCLLSNYMETGEVSEFYHCFAEDYFGSDRYRVLRHMQKRMYEMGTLESGVEEMIAAKEFDVEEFIRRFAFPVKSWDLIREIYHMIEDEIANAKEEQRQAVLYLYIPSHWQYMHMLLLIMSNRNENYKNMDFKCMFCGKTDLQDQDLIKVENFIAAYSMALYHLNVYDFLGNKGMNTRFDLLPAYVITKNKALFVSEDGEMFLEIEDRSRIDNLIIGYLEAVRGCSLFFGKLDESIYLNRLTNTKYDSGKSYVLGNNLCLEAFLEQEDMKSFIGNETRYPDLALAAAIEFYENVKNSDLSMIFSSDSLFQIENDARENSEYLKILDILEGLHQHYTEHPEKHIAMFDSRRFRFHSRIHLNLFVETTVVALDGAESRKRLFEKNMAFMLSPVIAESFRDFFLYITNSSICMTREESLNVLKMFIDTKRKEICDSIA